MLLKSSIEKLFKREFYNLVQIFKSFGYLKTKGSYNNDEVKYVTDIDIQFRMNTKSINTFDNYYNTIVSILSNLDIYFKSNKTKLVFEAVKVFEEINYTKLTSSNDNNTIKNNNTVNTVNINNNITNKLYTIEELIKNKDYIKNIYDKQGIIKLNMFLNYSNGLYYIPIDLIMIQTNKLSEDLSNVKSCILYKISSNKNNYIKSLKNISSCILILDRLKVIKLPNDLLDKPKLSSHTREPALIYTIIKPIKTKKQLSHPILTTTSKNKSIKHITININTTHNNENGDKKMTKFNKKLVAQIRTSSSISLKDKLKFNRVLLEIFKDIKTIINNNYYMYSIFNYVYNIDKIINLPDILFKRLYNKSSIYNLYTTSKKIISCILKNKDILDIKNKDIFILSTIYKIKLTTTNCVSVLQPIINKLKDIELAYQLSFKQKALAYYAQYLSIANKLL
jgi:hypothetical protein